MADVQSTVEDPAIDLVRKIPIANLYHMLCYAWNFFDLNDEVRVRIDDSKATRNC